MKLEQLSGEGILSRADQVKDLRKDELRDTMNTWQGHIAISCDFGGLTSADQVNNGSVVSYAQEEALMDIVKRIH